MNHIKGPEGSCGLACYCMVTGVSFEDKVQEYLKEFWLAEDASVFRMAEYFRGLGCLGYADAIARETIVGVGSEEKFQGRGIVIVNGSFMRHGLAYEDGMFYNPAPDGKVMNEEEFKKYLAAHDFEIERVIPKEKL
jgi:hypothetical protein